MRPFASLRWWYDGSPLPQRVLAVLGAAMLIAALTWVLVPPRTSPQHTSTAAGVGATTAGSSAGGGSTNGASAGGAAPVSGTGTAGPASASPGAPGAGGSTAASAQGAASAPGAVAGTGNTGPSGSPQTPGGATPAGGAGCAAPPGTDQGVSATQIKIAIVVVNIVGPAANSTFGVASAAEQQQDYQQVIDSINASGGVACRQLVPEFYTVNPVDQSDQQSKCLQIENAGVFAVMDYGGYAEAPGLAYGCFSGKGLPFFIDTSTFAKEQKQYYPYLLSPASTADLLYHNTIKAFAARGVFSPASGFKKLGYIYESCEPELTSEVNSELSAAGISPSQVVSYDFGCPSSPEPNPADVEQAVLKFQQAGVTDATEFQAYTIFGSFTSVAQQQGFHPKYDLPDDGIIGISYGPEHPDYQNVANAVAIEGARFGEEYTPGFSPSAGTARCNAIYAAHGRPPVYKQPAGAGGTACDEVWLLVTGLAHASRLERSAVAAGLQAAGSVDVSYPYGPNQFGPGVTTGGEFWRVDQFHTSCNCWQIIDPTFHPSFP